jgi:hypothetical protein
MEAASGISAECMQGAVWDCVIILDADQVPGDERIVVHFDGEHGV